MKLSAPDITQACPEQEIIDSLLTLDNKEILELGCGKADITRLIAIGGSGRRITATEVDETQHRLNLQIDDLPNVTFIAAGSQDLPLQDNRFDQVFMFKSLHHVPIEAMSQALAETHRVLKPGGLAYISEPIFAGDFNAVLKLFHDEEQVRLAAFNAIVTALDNGLFSLVQQQFFNQPLHFKSFAEFENQVIKVTHSNHQLSAALLERVRAQFETHSSAGGYNFLQPIRVDLLRKPQ